LGDVLGGQPAPGQGVGQLHHRVVLAQVERLEPLRLGQRVEWIDGVDSRLRHRHPPSPPLDTHILYLYVPRGGWEVYTDALPDHRLGCGVKAGLAGLDL
jgi:hypothetical protein